jgi:hypothetical protein
MSENKSKLAQIREILFSTDAKEVKLAEMKLEDGVTVLEAEAFEAGNAVMVLTEDEQRIPLPVNEEGYLLEDGRLLVVVEEGMIAEIKEAGSEEEVEQPQEEAVAASDAPTETPLPKAVIESVVKETKFSKEAEDKIAELEAKVAELSKVEEVVETKEEVELAQPIVHNPESEPVISRGFKHSQGRPQTTLDRVMSKISKLK